MKKALLLLLVLLAVGCPPAPGAAAVFETRNDLAGYFQGFNGTFVLYDQTGDSYIVYNEPQSGKRLSPCSTFKIFNSLIGLETGVLPKEDAATLFKWNGVVHANPAWNRDHTLASATRESVVWYYQELASRIGGERMQRYLADIGYGNADIAGGLTTFWLHSSLQISAMEQVALLARLYAGQLPFAPDTVETVKGNLTLAASEGTRFMGKTGSAYADGRWQLGWFVGCVETQGKRYIFATNIEAGDGAHGPAARKITEAILRDYGILN